MSHPDGMTETEYDDAIVQAYNDAHPHCEVCGTRGCQNVISCSEAHTGSTARDGRALTQIDGLHVHAGACYRLAVDTNVQIEQAAEAANVIG